MYGKGVLGSTIEEKSNLLQPFIDDRSLLQRRMLLGLGAALTLPSVDKDRIGAIGFCFGGMCCLDLVRTGANIQAIVSFHGLLNAPENISDPQIKSELLILHGHKDPMVTPENVLEFEKEMEKAQAKWQLHTFGQAYHAFMNPQANDYDLGTVYNAQVEKDAWLLMENFFEDHL